MFHDRGGTCRTGAYPGVDGLQHGRAVVHARRTERGYLGGGSSASLVLRRGQDASALLEGLLGPVPWSPCPRYTALAVTPPDGAVSVVRPARTPLCSLQIHPLVPGTTGGAGPS